MLIRWWFSCACLLVSVGTLWRLQRLSLSPVTTTTNLLEDAEWDVLFPLPASARIRLSNELGGYNTTPLAEWRALHNSPGRSYPSELVDGGSVAWQTVTAGRDGVVRVDVSNVQSKFLESALGLGVTAYTSGWAITKLTVPVSGTYLVSCGAVNRFRVGENGAFFQGDYYAWYPTWGANAWVKWPVRLNAGDHTLLVQLRRSAFSCSVDPLAVDQREAPPVLAPGVQGGMWKPAIYAPSVFEGRLASPFLGVPLLNASPRRLAVVAASLAPPLGVAVRGRPVIEPGQAVQPVLEVLEHETAIRLDCHGGKAGINVTFEFEDVAGSSTIPLAEDRRRRHRLVVPVELACWVGDPRVDAIRFTYLDVDGSVQTAAAKPPVDGDRPAVCPDAGCPVVLATHGAGVDAESMAWTGAFKPVQDAWMLFPTNRAPFGYDWEGLGIQNALAALRGLALWRPGAPRGSLAVDTHSLVLTGHSMGGHGCLVLATHMADRALGVACAAGWIRFDQYIQEWTSVESTFADDVLLGLLSSSAARYHTDAFASHLRGVPFVARMGGSDDNVHPWNLRRFARAVDLVNGLPHWSQVLEEPGRGHWFDDVMSSSEMAAFFDRALLEGKPALPADWRVKSLGGWNEGRGGVRILQPINPFTAAWVDVAVVRQDGAVSWRLRTENVRRLALCKTPGIEGVSRRTRVYIDDAEVEPRLWPLCFPEDRAGLFPQRATAEPEAADSDAPQHAGADPGPRRLTSDDALTSQSLRGVFGAPANGGDARSGLLFQERGGGGNEDDKDNPPPGHYLKTAGIVFAATADEGWLQDERSAANGGPLAQIVEGSITFVCGTRGPPRHAAAVRAWALLAANTLFSRGRVAAAIVTDEELLSDAALRTRTSSSRLVMLGGPSENAVTASLLGRSTFAASQIAFSDDRRGLSSSRGRRAQHAQGAMEVEAEGYQARNGSEHHPSDSSTGFSVGDLHFDEPGVGIIALGQVGCSDCEAGTEEEGGPTCRTIGLELSGLQQRCRRGQGAQGTLLAVVAGTDVDGFERAARLFPSEPNAQIPDWMVVGPDVDWQAAGGVLALGFYDHAWRLLPGMSYPRV